MSEDMNALKIVLLKELLEQRFDNMERTAGKTAEALNMRLESMNLFRDQLRDQAARFITRDELNAISKGRSDTITVIEQKLANLEGRLWAFGAVVLLVASVLGPLPALLGK